MTIDEHQDWLVEFYKGRDWYRFSPMNRLVFLSEEIGELSRAVRTIELNGRDHPGDKILTNDERLDNLKEELADCFDQLLIISSQYGIRYSALSDYSKNKLKKRFETNNRSV